MKLKAIKKRIFKLNETLKESVFDEEVEISIKFNCVFLGKETPNQEFEPIQLIYKPHSIKELNYLYQIKILGAGLQYTHLAYVRTTIFQHIWIQFIKSIKFITNFENIFKILTILCLLISTILPFIKKESINIYVSEPKVKNIIVVDTTKNTINFTVTTKIIIDTITTKKAKQIK